MDVLGMKIQQKITISIVFIKKMKNILQRYLNIFLLYKNICKMEISLKDIPEYLKKSQLYRNFLENSENENDNIQINPNHRKDINIQSFDDLCFYLDIYRYWMLDESVKDLFYNYVKNNNIDILYLRYNFTTLDLIDEFKYIRKFDESSCSFAAKNGNINLLKYLHKNGCIWDEETIGNAVKNGHYDCLIYAHENGCSMDLDICKYAALHGHLDCLIYAHEKGYPWAESTCNEAAENGHLECLKYAHENGCPWNEWTTEYAAKNNHLDCLMYAHENGCPWNELTCIYAADNGHLYCLNYAIDNGCPFDKEICLI